MALVNPNIALSVKSLDIPQNNLLAQYAQLAQVQNAQQQQELHQAQLAEYQRARAEDLGVSNYLANTKDLTLPEARAPLLGMGKPGREIYKNLTESDAARLAQDTA